MQVLQVLLIDDIRVNSEQLAQGLRYERSISEVATVTTLQEALHCLAERVFDMALLNMAATKSLAILHAITAHDRSPPVIALGVPEIEEHVIACAEAGAAGYLPKRGSFADLLTVMNSVARGETVCSPRMAAMLLRRVATLAAQQEPDPRNARLTPREHQVLVLIEQGLSNKDIARRLSIEVRTVKNHVHNIFDKLHVRSRGEAAARARAALSVASSVLPPAHIEGGRAVTVAANERALT